MSSRPEPRVDAYIAALPEWHQAVCREVRRLVHEADPDVRGGAVPAAPLAAMVRQIIANNRAGGWRKLTRERDVSG